MSRGSCPYLLSIALAAPGASHALGLGEIHIDSKLNQPLAAHIDLVGASDAEIASLRASIAGRDAFQRAGLDRPAFLNSAEFSVSRDRQDRPILTLHSRDAFTEPVIELLVELHWPGGALIREYTLLLDPAGAPDSSALNTVAAPVSPQPVSTAPTRSILPVTPVAAATGASSKADRSPTRHAQTDERYTVQPRDTLHGIARSLGARTRPEMRRLMMAIFHLNPDAFQDNINRLLSGVTLQIPSPDQLARATDAEVAREFRQQMQAWRMDGRPENLPTQASLADPQPVRSRDSGATGQTQETAALIQRIATLEQTLAGIREQIARDDVELQSLRQQVRSGAAALQFTKSADEPAAPVASTHNTTSTSRTDLPATRRLAGIRMRNLIGGGVAALILGALAFWGLRRRRPITPEDRAVQDPLIPPDEEIGCEPVEVMEVVEPVETPPRSTAEASIEVTEVSPPIQEAPAPNPAADAAAQIIHDLEETLVIESPSDEIADGPEATARLKRDENLADLEKTAQHVFIEGDLNGSPRSTPFVERRRGVIDVLRAAIDKEPHRRDLKLKLLELYYATSAANLASFLEVAKMMSREPDMLASEDWEHIVQMGRAILPDERLFMEDPGASDEISPVKENVA